MIKYNKGEWSEFYVLLRLLADKKLSPADESFEKLTNIVYPIIKIIRHYKNATHEYEIQDSLIRIKGSSEEISIPVSEFDLFSKELLKAIKAGKGASFSVEGAEQLLGKMQSPSVKASSTDKADIHIVIHDQRTGQMPRLGFSIKSQLGKPSTLFNAGKTTNFIYDLSGAELTESAINHVNSMVKVRGEKRSIDLRGRLSYLSDKGIKLKFSHTQNNRFSNNLHLIDSSLPIILGEMLLEFYMKTPSSIIDILNVIEGKNTLQFDNSEGHPFYRYKIKRFLTDVALGMLPSKVWDGTNDANGGYIIIRSDGEIICYHLYGRNLFEDYLLTNTRFDTPSTSKYEFGKIFKENGRLYLKLCMQIRFKK